MMKRQVKYNNSSISNTSNSSITGEQQTKKCTHIFSVCFGESKMGKELLINHCVISFTDKFPKCQTREDKMIFYWNNRAFAFSIYLTVRGSAARRKEK